jgi:hypothetical protein
VPPTVWWIAIPVFFARGGKELAVRQTQRVVDFECHAIAPFFAAGHILTTGYQRAVNANQLIINDSMD